MPNITKIEPIISPPKRLKVAAYARVSMESERLNHSLSAQVSYYSQLIQRNPKWEYAGVYADEGISGTGTSKRDEFNRMLADCDMGKIDIILTKSISRFARNTVDLLKTVRHLKEMGIEVIFEKENINSMSADGELMMTILASFAQEEVTSLSNNVKWAVRKSFEKGVCPTKFRIYGYRWECEKLVIDPYEREVIKFIFDSYLSGKMVTEITRELREKNIKTHTGIDFTPSSVSIILKNITYTGNLLLQKEYVADAISHKVKKNKGELPQYFVENTHEPIITMEIFNQVQAEINRRREMGALANKALNTSCFTSKIKCSVCGKNYNRRTDGKSRRQRITYSWHCSTKLKFGTLKCSSDNIPEIVLKRKCAEVLGTNEFDEALFTEKVKQIIMQENNKMNFIFYDGTSKEVEWQKDPKNSWWTYEKRKAWSERCRNKELTNFKKRNNEFTNLIECGHCGKPFRSKETKYVDGTSDRIFYCSDWCGNKTIKVSTLKKLICEILELDTFSEKEMADNIRSISIDGNKAIFNLISGNIEVREFTDKKKGIKHTEEYKEKMRNRMKKIWEEGIVYGKKKSNNDTRDNK